MAQEKIYSPEEVLDLCRKYMNQEHVDFVNKAYEAAKYVHNDQKRNSGEPYIVHPTQVAAILAELMMDPDTVAAGYLHDVVEDTKLTLGDIHELFGEDVATIVDGVTKLSKFKYKSHQELLAENHRKMLLAMSKDLRVIMVKLADRLHNMRTLKHLRPDKQRRIANETLEIYAPLADRLGISKIKWELEDLSLHYLNPQQYYRIVHLMKSKREQRISDIEEAITEIKKSLVDLDIRYDIYGRPKHIYSIYKKMHDKHKQFSELYDLSAIRIIVDSVKDCYAVLGEIHTKWKPMPGRFKDYIAMPKANGYQSLHTTVIGPSGKPLEVQIRTEQMHEVAEYGIAAHWAYKEGMTNGIDLDKDDQKIDVFREILEIQNESQDATDFMNNVKGDIFSDRVYVFTPEGEVLELPKGSITLDFAFQVHTEVGSHSVGAKVNGKIVPLNYQLKNGDIVEMMTSSTAKPNRDWLNLVHTSKAKNKIRRAIKDQEKSENEQLGREMVEKLLEERGFVPKNILVKENVAKVVKKYDFKDERELFSAVGYGKPSTESVVNKLTFDEVAAQKAHEKSELETKILNGGIENNNVDSVHSKISKDDEAVNVDDSENLLIRLAKCCNPIPGDGIVGYITKGRGVTIHRDDCPNILDPEAQKRLIDVSWNDVAKDNRYVSEIEVYGYNRNGLLNDVLQILNSNTNTLNNVSGKIDNDKTAHISVSIGVKTLEHLNGILDKLRSIQDVYEVKRKM
ncbi:bifunctional (p)ppGpp synthetase/guanosine-3',5'-bis(diphosphate) 3'-pyrophosphohydrolase [Lactobacillus sp. YT155]|uniref:RelA/SpoT family protein n=1 Tax=Lactobacillus sp. YT155 TaxID=3060955 RepID=UPI00265DB81A|nr:bifunctional (p)ppGpp synthetase/guanosine-3',5'-bis(diphosphate) 3'-pyrophosphohydrolase [Lactobacillus sp. YT155]MDO1605476.1 bifunctional (p)ppGpp synthetase/guanosine-3',5'-bis(diphosphate) 3'-pyrophosphohydrolase [Lactobacillus sp. YT155]